MGMFDDFYSDYLRNFFNDWSGTFDDKNLISSEHYGDGLIKKVYEVKTPNGYQQIVSIAPIKESEKVTEDVGKEVTQKILDLSARLNDAVEREDYETAIECRDTIKRLEGIKNDVLDLSNKKKDAIAEQNYELASELKTQIDALLEGESETKE